MRRPWVILALLSAAAHASIDIQVEGNAMFRGRTIAEALPPDPEDFGEDELAAWREDAVFNAEDLYRRSGYIEARVDVELARKEGGGPEDWAARVTVVEGERYLFDSVSVRLAEDTASGADSVGAGAGARAPGVDTAALASLVDVGELSARPGEPFVEDALFRDRRQILRRFGNAGFVKAQVDDRTSIRRGSKTVRVVYSVIPSYPVVFDTLVLRNMRARPADSLRGITDEAILRDLVPYRRGDTVRISRNDRLVEKLNYTGVFNYARLKDSLIDEGGGRSALILQAEERVPGDFRTSLFFETMYGLGVSVDARHSNVAGSLNEVRSGAALAVDRQSGYLGYGSPITFGKLVRFDNLFQVDWTQHQEINREQGLFGGDFTALNTTSLTLPWSYWLRLVGSAELDAKSLRVETGLERDVNLNFIQTTFLSFLNQPMDPTRGVRLAFSLGNGGPLFRDDRIQLTRERHNWVEAQTAYYYYYPPLPEVKLAFRADAGRFFGAGGTNSLRFLLGGPRSVRSYEFRDLCPEKDSEGACPTKEDLNRTGKPLEPAYFLLSHEMRIDAFAFPLFPRRGFMKHLTPLQLVPFYDIGKVWDQNVGLDFSKQVSGQGEAFGLGIRYPLLGVFNLRLDFAYGRRGRGPWPDEYVLDLAQAF